MHANLQLHICIKDIHLYWREEIETDKQACLLSLKSS